MTNLWALVVVLAAAAVVQAQVPSFGWCPDHLPQTEFDMERFLGTWYEAERYVNVLEAGSRCVRTDYTMAKDGRVLVANRISNRLTGVVRVLNGEIRSNLKAQDAKLNVKYSTLPYPVETSYTVLNTDYDSYSVMWSCSGLGLFNTQNAWVMTREQNPSASTLQKAYAVLDKYKISRTFFVKTDQTDCQIAEPAEEESNDVDKEEDEGAKSAVAEAVVSKDESKPEAVVAAAEEVVKPEDVKPAVNVVKKEPVVAPVAAEIKPEAEKEIQPTNEVEKENDKGKSKQ